MQGQGLSAGQSPAWHGSQPSWHLQTGRRGTPPKLLAEPSLPRIGNADPSMRRCGPKSWISADHRATRLKVPCDFTNEALEGEFADEELGGLLVATDFAEGDLFQGRNDGESS